jgi:phosphopantothenoylcysteine decarboxylase/phosphopantothenate--cysteine ligase
MTRSAEEFVRPLTFAALTGHKVITNLFATGGAEDTLSSAIEHIRVAQDSDILVVAPATADLIAKFAHGLADDFLTTTYLAFTGPVVLAPAMNTNMWNHPATQANIRTLRERGHIIVEPGSGPLACGMVGPGRLPDPEVIAAAALSAMQPPYAISKAKPSSSPPAQHRSRSIPSATSRIAPAAKWVTPSPPTRRLAAHA